MSGKRGIELRKAARSRGKWRMPLFETSEEEGEFRPRLPVGSPPGRSGIRRLLDRRVSVGTCVHDCTISVHMYRQGWREKVPAGITLASPRVRSRGRGSRPALGCRSLRSGTVRGRPNCRRHYRAVTTVPVLEAGRDGCVDREAGHQCVLLMLSF